MKYIGDDITTIREKFQAQIDSVRDVQKSLPNFTAGLSQLDSEHADFFRNALVEADMETARTMKRSRNVFGLTDEEIAEKTHLPVEVVNSL